MGVSAFDMDIKSLKKLVGIKHVDYEKVERLYLMCFKNKHCDCRRCDDNQTKK